MFAFQRELAHIRDECRARFGFLLDASGAESNRFLGLSFAVICFGSAAAWRQQPILSAESNHRLGGLREGESYYELVESLDWEIMRFVFFLFIAKPFFGLCI